VQIKDAKSPSVMRGPDATTKNVCRFLKTQELNGRQFAKANLRMPKW